MANTIRPVTEAEIAASEDCSAARDYARSLKLSRDMLDRTADLNFRMRLLFGIVLCAAMLERQEVLDFAYKELNNLPEPDELRVLANLNRAFAEYELGRPANALHIVDTGLQTGLFDKEGWKIHKYRCFFSKGVSLTSLKRPSEGLECLDAAHSLYPSEASAGDETERSIFRRLEPRIQIARANCLLGLDHYEDSYFAAEKVKSFDDAELAALALQYMAECRVWQGRVPEALEIYADLKKRLPCRFVDEERIKTGVANCVSYLERIRGAARPV